MGNTERMTVAQFRAQHTKGARMKGTLPTVVDGQRFDSKLEADRYLRLKNLWHIGAIKWFICQVPFRLPGGVVYRADFLIVWNDDSITIEDCKGWMTEVSALKIKQVEEIYGIKVELVKKEKKR